ncbi:MAG: flagellar biosynthetic protein FliP [Desulfurobacterium sp.]|nr:MAG: flagellar biosynthetic protein FliP [Desulfurobacterium sp.]
MPVSALPAELSQSLATSLKLLLILTVLTILPTIIIAMTSFTRIVIILALLRQAIGTPTTPPAIVIVTLSLILTGFIMRPTLEELNRVALQPYIAKEINEIEFLQRGIKPFQKFMLKNTRKKDLKFFLELAKVKVSSPEEIPLTVLIPAFLVSELTVAFQIVFVVYLPFLLVDIIVASILMSLGMMMLPPVMVSLPIKILLFIAVDGWELLIGSIVRSYH